MRIKDMDREGIDVAVLFATVVSSFCALDSVDFEVAMIRAYHRWLADYCAAYPDRMKGVAIVPMRAPELAAERNPSRRERAVVRRHLPSAHMEDKLLDHPAFHPIWKACAGDGPARVLSRRHGAPALRDGHVRDGQQSVHSAFGDQSVRGDARDRVAGRRRRAGYFSRNCALRSSKRAWDGCRSGWSASTSITS